MLLGCFSWLCWLCLDADALVFGVIIGGLVWLLCLLGIVGVYLFVAVCLLGVLWLFVNSVVLFAFCC